jgi:hypothetical protein
MSTNNKTICDANRMGAKLTVAEICTDLRISRRTFYEWRAKGNGAPVHPAS